MRQSSRSKPLRPPLSATTQLRRRNHQIETSNRLPLRRQQPTHHPPARHHLSQRFRIRSRSSPLLQQQPPTESPSPRQRCRLRPTRLPASHLLSYLGTDRRSRTVEPLRRRHDYAWSEFGEIRAWSVLECRRASQQAYAIRRGGSIQQEQRYVLATVECEVEECSFRFVVQDPPLRRHSTRNSNRRIPTLFLRRSLVLRRRLREVPLRCIILPLSRRRQGTAITPTPTLRPPPLRLRLCRLVEMLRPETTAERDRRLRIHHRSKAARSSTNRWNSIPRLSRKT